MADAVRAAVVEARLAGLLMRAEESPAFHALADRVASGGTVALADASAGALAEGGRAVGPGTTLPWQGTAAWLLSLGYEPVPEVSEPGTFSRRGGIIDVYPASATEPARIELFGNEIESIRSFDPVTQRSQATPDEPVVLP